MGVGNRDRGRDRDRESGAVGGQPIADSRDWGLGVGNGDWGLGNGNWGLGTRDSGLETGRCFPVFPKVDTPLRA